MKRARGYTVVEVMIALTLLAVGTSGIIAMQKVTSVTNRDSKNLLIANQIARTWMERLRVDAVKWNHPSNVNSSSDLDDTLWLKQIVTGNWVRPTDDVRGSAAADAFGNDVRDADADTGSFCTHIRLSWLYGPPAGGALPPFLIRAEVRVFWLRDGGPGGIDGPVCRTSTDPGLVSPAVNRYHFVYVASAIAQNMAM
jgi:prepilin-type N-terminal cleavage/methylation domain-containing protein